MKPSSSMSLLSSHDILQATKPFAQMLGFLEISQPYLPVRSLARVCGGRQGLLE